MARPGRGSDDGWFRLGQRRRHHRPSWSSVLAIVSFVVWALEPPGKPIQSALPLDPDSVHPRSGVAGITWPIAYPGGMGFFDVIAVALLVLRDRDRAAARQEEDGLVPRPGDRRLGLLWVAVVEIEPLYGPCPRSTSSS